MEPPLSPTPRFSLVIPAYNEEGYLPRLLDSVEVARERYGGGREAVEVIVADNASTDATARLARERGCRVARVEKRVIAAARNGGAALARGEVLCFVDADFRIHPATFEAVEHELASGRAVAGATGVVLERWSVGLAATYALLLPLIVLMRIDSGVVFCRRRDFEAVGGYDESRHFAEDVDFLWRLRRLGRRRGERLVRATSAKALASTRKFDKHGEWHYFRLLVLGVRHLLGSGSLEKLAREYWYEDR